MIDRETVKCECTDGFYGRYCERGNLKIVQFFALYINLFLIVIVNCISRTRPIELFFVPASAPRLV